ncbi:Enoyl-CoA hydratase [Rhizoclosmatium sp. JEL0117]|nr:Enoyl-CoA hydratase [Rhizoclosmatium sp. JEL0117]
MRVAILTGRGGVFCAGADLKGVVGVQGEANIVSEDMNEAGPMGPTRLRLTKPVIAAIEGFAVAGGLELAIWCDLRVASEVAILGVFCRMRGVPLIDGGTVRLPPLIGLSNAMDLVLTGRSVSATEAKGMGLVNWVVPEGLALSKALEVAKLIATHPQTCMRNDRLSMLDSVYRGSWLNGNSKTHKSESSKGIFNVRGAERDAMQQELLYGIQSMRIPEFGDAIKLFLNKSKL